MVFDSAAVVRIELVKVPLDLLHLEQRHVVLPCDVPDEALLSGKQEVLAEGRLVHPLEQEHKGDLVTLTHGSVEDLPRYVLRFRVAVPKHRPDQRLKLEVRQCTNVGKVVALEHLPSLRDLPRRQVEPPREAVGVIDRQLGHELDAHIAAVHGTALAVQPRAVVLGRRQQLRGLARSIPSRLALESRGRAEVLVRALIFVHADSRPLHRPERRGGAVRELAGGGAEAQLGPPHLDARLREVTRHRRLSRLRNLHGHLPWAPRLASLTAS
mmetsp:Transcript_23768/g.67265  ORF Transcript_23768/g.67265 Transcript_23768/m.67265 type:complete len:269 (-) Transcript_23768:767-1573(-)